MCLTHVEFADLVQRCGGVCLRRPRQTGFALVVGRSEVTDDEESAESQIFRRARRLQLCGYPIEVLSEEDFLDRLGLAQFAASLRGPHTMLALTRMLDVSAAKLRRWLREGLIQPIANDTPLPRFDFHEVALIKQIQEQFEAGVTTSAIRRGIEAARNRLPDDLPLNQHLARIVSDGTILMRIGDSLIDQSGQLHFDFEEDASPSLRPLPRHVDVDAMCDQALACEDEERFEEAASLYQAAIDVSPNHPVLYFDLGNVQFERGQLEDAVSSYSRATELDPEFALAWHNLGSALAQQAKWEPAAAALRRCLRLKPDHADTHQTLSEVMRRMGNPEDARHHQDLFRRHSFEAQLGETRSTLLRVFR